MVKIDLENINKKYNKNDGFSVENFNLSVKDKEFIVIVGPSGCGKSTTLRMIAGLEKITSGTLKIDGQVMNAVPSKDRNIAMVFQDYGLYPHMTVYDNLAFNLLIRKVKTSVIENKIKAVANILNLENFLARKPADLSGGQMQRVALGRAMVRDTKIFLMDEPLSNLDAKLRATMRIEIAKIHRNLQTTSIYVTHDQTEAMTLADRMVVMKDGVIQQIGSPKDIYHHPVNKFVASFIGLPAMNFLDVYFDGEYLRLDNLTKLLPDQEEEQLLTKRGYKERKISLGIRPTDLKIFSRKEIEIYGSVVSGKVVNLELFGAKSMLYLDVANQSVAVQVEPDCDYQIGECVDLVVNSDKLYFFDRETTKSIIE